LTSGRPFPVTREASRDWLDVIQRLVVDAPTAFAVTTGKEYLVVYLNPAFLRVMGVVVDETTGRPIADALPADLRNSLVSLLGHAQESDLPLRDVILERIPSSKGFLSCSVWAINDSPASSRQLMIEVRDLEGVEHARIWQREIAERMVLSALRDEEIAADANLSRERSIFLADASRELAKSLDEQTTLRTMVRLALPRLGAWCVADLIGQDNATNRLIVVDPDPLRVKLAQELQDCWSPSDDEPLASARAMPTSGATVLGEGVDALIGASDGGNPECRRLLTALGVGPILTVPLTARDSLIGSVTFVRHDSEAPYTDEDIKLAEDIASRSAMALSSAQLFGDAERFRTEAETANQAKTYFLRAMSHELRTPLNAIGGYVDLIEMGIRGPVTAEQRTDLGRIKANQRRLIGLVDQILDLAKVDRGLVQYVIVDLNLRSEILETFSMLLPLAVKKSIAVQPLMCEEDVVARADGERLNQILVNLIGNAIKFSRPGGRIGAECEPSESVVIVRIRDRGIGIPADKLKDIFEPFVQAHPSLTDLDAGIGLGLAISRELARGMGGDITVESTLGEGSCFTLTLPRGTAEPEADRPKS
jgi:signal transduction histidine kinase